MRRIPLDDELRKRLGELTGEIALTDAAGNVVAYIVEPQFREAAYDMASALFDDDEIEIARKQTGGKTTAEVLAVFKSLDDLLSGQGAA